MSMEPAHECAMKSDDWSLFAACPEDGTGTGTIVGIVISVVALAAVGVGIWWLVNKRNQ